MEYALFDYVLMEGEELSAEGHQPIQLEGADRVYSVYSGGIDLFAVAAEDSTPIGPRTFIGHIEAECFFFDPPRFQYPSELMMLAVGQPGTVVMSLPLAQVLAHITHAAMQEEFNLWLESWLLTLSRSIAIPRKDGPLEWLMPTHAHRMTPETALAARGSPLWVIPSMDGLQLCGHPMPLAPETGVPSVVAVPPGLWIDSRVQQEIQVIPTARLTPEQTTKGLGNFIEGFLATVDGMAQDTQRSAHQRSQDRTRRDQALFQQVDRGLQGLFDRHSPRQPLDIGALGPLEAACYHVTRATGIRLRMPRGLSDGDGPIRKKLEALCHGSGCRVRKVTLRGDWWHQDLGPLLAFRKAAGGPVALLPETPGLYQLLSPEGEKSQRLDAQTAVLLESNAYVFYRTFDHRVLDGLALLRFGLLGAGRDVWHAAVWGTVGGILTMALPFVTGQIFDSVIPAADRSGLFQLLVALIVASVMLTVFRIVRDIAVIRLQTRSGAVIQAAVMDRLLRLPVRFFRQFTSGDLAHRANGISQIHRLVSGVATTSLVNGTFGVFYLLVLVLYSPPLALLAVTIALLAFLVTAGLTLASMDYRRHAIKLRGKQDGQLLQMLRAIGKIRAALAEVRAYHRWALLFFEQRWSDHRADRLQSIQRIFSANVPLFSLVSLFYLTMRLQETSSNAEISGLSTGAFLAFVSAFVSLLGVVFDLSGAVLTLLEVVPIYERAIPILSTQPELEPSKTAPGRLKGEIEVSHVRLRYAEDGADVLRDLSLHILPGEFVAIVGPSGAGKSSLLRLLLAFERPYSGGVYYDGQNLGELDVLALRKQIGTVLQGAGITEDDVFHSIVGSNPLTLDEAWEAARLAGLDEDIRRMPMQMHTMVGEDGNALSGGQRQRLLIARALINHPRILLFDEATSALDNQTQRVVTESLEMLRITRIVIAHRLSTIRKADRIIVLEKGQVVESGTFAALMENDGVFASLAQRQMIA